MPLASIIRFLQRLAVGALYLLLVAGITFVAVTQTSRGREVLNTVLVDRFNAQFDGTVRIERIEGSIIGNFYARQVELLDPQGRVTATARAIELSPRWVDLLHQKLTVRHLTVQKPVIHLMRSPDGGFTLLDALTTSGTSKTASGWELSFADVSIRDGELHTIRQRSDSAAAPPWMFDYTNASFDSINVRGTVEWAPDAKLIDIQSASLYNRDLPLAVRTLQGQFVIEGDRLSLNQVFLQTRHSQLAFGGHYDRSDWHSAQRDDVRSQQAVSFILHESIVSGNELSSAFPAVSLSDSVRLSADVHGNAENLTIDRIQLSRGGSSIDGSGSLEYGTDSLAFAFTVPETTVNPEDLAAVWPDSPAADYAHLGKIDAGLSAHGVLHMNLREQAEPTPRLVSSARLDLEGAMGHVAGEIGLRSGRNRPISYDVDLSLRGLDIGRIERRPRLVSRLNGSFEASGRGLTRTNLDATASLRLGASTLAGRSIDSLAVDLQADPERIGTETRLYQYGTGGFLYSEAEVTSPSENPSYRLYLTTRNLDLNPLFAADDVGTSLNASITANGRASPESELRGEALVTVDSSQIHRPSGDYTIRPAVSQVALRSRYDPRPRFSLHGDILDVEVRGDFTIRTLFETGRLWTAAYRRALHEVRQKPRMPYDTLRGSSLTGWSGRVHRMAATRFPADTAASPVPDPPELQSRLASAGLSEGSRGVIEARLHRAELLTTVLASSPVLRGSIQTRTAWKANADSVRLDISVASDSLIGPRLRVRDFTADALLRSIRGEPAVASGTRYQIHAEAPYVELPMQTFRENRLDIEYEDGRARVQVESGRIGAASALQTDVRLHLLDDRNRLIVDTVRLRMRDSQWSTTGSPVIDLYQNAAVFRDVALENPLSDAIEPGDSVQSIAIDGVLSTHSTDTAHVRARNLHLAEFSRILAMNNPIGGVLTADLALTQTGGTAETTGSLNVDRLSYDGHPLGTLTAESRYHPVHDALNLDVTIAHEQPLANGIQNHVELAGSIGLPERSTTERYLNPGFLDLSVDVGEADLFFFENIFPGVVENVRGTASGTGSIRGDFRWPIFEADLTIADSSQFYQPDFNLDYQMSGPITVGSEGFNVDGMRITDPTGGTAALSGDILFNEYEFFSFDIQAELDELQTINVSSSRNLPFYGQIWSSGTAHLTGPIYDALLRSPNVVTTANSELYIPVTSVSPETDDTFIVFADSTGEIPDVQRKRRRENILADRPPGERPFLDGLDMNLNIDAPRGSTVHLVFDPLLGDAVEAVGTGRIQLGVNEGEFTTFGTFNITGGEYLFTAGDMFSRRFELEPGGTITWDGDPIDAQLSIPATYRTRASLDGLPGSYESAERIPLVISLQLTGRVTSPITEMNLAIDRDEYTNTARITSLQPVLSDEQRADEYATSVLLTNSFALTADGEAQGRGLTEQLAFSTVSQLVANQLNRFINHALSNVDVNLGMQRGMTVQDLDVTYGVALYLMDERLIIRGRGVYETTRSRSSSDHLQGKLTVEIRLSPTVSMEVFYRREEGLLESASTVAPSYGAGVSYQTDFTNWRQFLAKQWNGWKDMWGDIFDFLGGSESPPSPSPETTAQPDSAAADSVAYTPIILRETIESPTADDSDPLSGN